MNTYTHVSLNISIVFVKVFAKDLKEGEQKEKKKKRIFLDRVIILAFRLPQTRTN